MKRSIIYLSAAALLAVFVGCAAHGRGCTGLMRGSCQTAPENCAACQDCGDPFQNTDLRCRACRGEGCERCGRHSGQATDPGPATGAITYPYYTTRGPRDFLARAPRSIGP